MTHLVFSSSTRKTRSLSISHLHFQTALALPSISDRLPAHIALEKMRITHFLLCLYTTAVSSFPHFNQNACIFNRKYRKIPNCRWNFFFCPRLLVPPLFLYLYFFIFIFFWSPPFVMGCFCVPFQWTRSLGHRFIDGFYN
jgi:hypothetical protein